jgi:hypothetical protein
MTDMQALARARNAFEQKAWAESYADRAACALPSIRGLSVHTSFDPLSGERSAEFEMAVV